MGTCQTDRELSWEYSPVKTVQTVSRPVDFRPRFGRMLLNQSKNLVLRVRGVEQPRLWYLAIKEGMNVSHHLWVAGQRITCTEDPSEYRPPRSSPGATTGCSLYDRECINTDVTNRAASLTELSS